MEVIDSNYFSRCLTLTHVGHQTSVQFETPVLHRLILIIIGDFMIQRITNIWWTIVYLCYYDDLLN